MFDNIFDAFSSCISENDFRENQQWFTDELAGSAGRHAYKLIVENSHIIADQLSQGIHFANKQTHAGIQRDREAYGIAAGFPTMVEKGIQRDKQAGGIFSDSPIYSEFLCQHNNGSFLKSPRKCTFSFETMQF